MIELPESPAPNGIEIEVVDFGLLLRPSGGGAPLRVNRPGARLRARISFPPMTPDTARVFNRRFQAATREGLRIDYPLLGLSQGAPGVSLVNGANPIGTTLPIKGLTPGYALKEGYALTLIDAAGERYTHFAGSAGMASAGGLLTVTGLEPPIRGVFADGATVLLAKPTLDLALTGTVGWSCSVDRLIRGATIEGEECAGLDPSLGS